MFPGEAAANLKFRLCPEPFAIYWIEENAR